MAAGELFSVFVSQDDSHGEKVYTCGSGHVEDTQYEPRELALGDYDNVKILQVDGGSKHGCILAEVSDKTRGPAEFAKAPSK